MNIRHQYLGYVCLTWEKWRLAYNLVLFAEFCLLPLFLREGIANQAASPGWVRYIVCAVLANAYYCFGPCLELYAYVLLGRRIGLGRYLLLAMGLLFLILWMGMIIL